MSAAPADHAVFFDALRRSSAKLLKLDPDDLSAAQSVRVDRVASLRMLIDGFQAAQLRGEAIDAKSFIAASQELERLLGGNPSAPTSRFASGEARAKLRKLLETTVLREDLLEDEAERLRVREREDAIQVQAALPVQAAPAPVSPPLRPDNVVPIDGAARANANLPPAHYLRDGQPREPWRDGRTFEVPSWPLPR